MPDACLDHHGALFVIAVVFVTIMLWSVVLGYTVWWAEWELEAGPVENAKNASNAAPCTCSTTRQPDNRATIKSAAER